MQLTHSADLPLHYGYVPQWLAERMAKFDFAITESIITEYAVHKAKLGIAIKHEQ